MANGLGDFASLLGQAYSQSARQREDEYESYRKKAQRQQLLTMFAAPIVQGLGEGVVDFAGDLFLGDNSKDFFSTREGNTLVRRLGSTQDALKDVESQISQMTKAAQGGDIYEGAYQLNREGAIQSLVGQHKGLGAEVEQIVLADIAGQEQELRDVSRVEVDDLIKFRDELRLAPSNEEVLRRYKASKLNRTVPQKLAAGLGNFIFRRDPKDLTDSAVRQILTGGDPKTQQADWYRMFQQDGYEENLSTRLREALDIRGANFDMDSETANFMTELMSIRPEFYASLPEEQNAKTSAITQDLAHRRMARKNPSYGIAYNEAKNVFGDRPSREQVEAIALRNLKGISKEALPDFVSTYRLGVGQEALKPVQDAFAGKLYKGKIFDDLDTPEQGPVDEATDKFLATLVGSFHRDLRVVKNKIGKENLQFNYNALLDEGAIESVAEEYLNRAITGMSYTPINPEDLKGKGLVDLVGSMFSDNPEILSGRISPEQTQELQSYIESVLTNKEEVERIQVEAIRSGRATTRERTDTQASFTQYGRVIGAVKDQVNEIMSDATTTKEEKKRELESLRQKAASGTERRAEANGYPRVADDFYTLLDELIEDSLYEDKFVRAVGRMPFGAQ